MSHTFEFIGGGPRDGHTTICDPKDLTWSFEHGHYEPVDGFQILAGHTPDDGDIYHLIWKPSEEGQQSRTITAQDELALLQPGSSVRDADGVEWELRFEDAAYWLSTNRFELTAKTINLPVTVLWEDPNAG